MTTRTRAKNNIRKIIKTGKTSLSVTMPKEYMDKLKWKEKQKVVVNMRGAIITIKDWKK